MLGVLFLICGVSLFALLFLGTALFGLLAVNNMFLSRQTGEDLLTFALEQDGITGPSKFLVRWEEISQVKQQTLGRAGQGGVKYVPRSINVHVRDHAGVIARAVSDQQYLLDREADGSGVMAIGLGATPEDELAAFMRVLESKLSRRQIPSTSATRAPSGVRTADRSWHLLIGKLVFGHSPKSIAQSGGRMQKNQAAVRGREVRARLVGAARELIPELGWSAVSTRLLAERAGVAPGLVHYHFSSLQALLREAAIGQIQEILEGMAPLLEEAEALDEGAELLLASLDGYTGRDQTSLLVTETYLAAGRDELLRDALAGLVTDFRSRLADWLRIRGVADHEAVASLVAAAIDGIMLHRPLNPDLTSSTVGPVLRRLLGRDAKKKGLT